MMEADLTPGADLSGADLTHADLKRANLSGADLTGATLTGATLTGAFASSETTWPIGFDQLAAGIVTWVPTLPR